jgi:hypothetical protein
METLGIGLATLIIVLWLTILLVWLVSFGTTLHSGDAWPDSSVLGVSEEATTASASGTPA